MNDLQNVFFATLVFGPVGGLGETNLFRQCNFLVLAASRDEALAKAQELGRVRASDSEQFLGVEELLSIDGEIQDGIELVWREGLWKEHDLELFLGEKIRKSTLADDVDTSPVGWYAGEVALLEVVESDSKEQDQLIWRNTYLLNESDARRALQRLETIGQQEQDAGEHTSDGHSATWRFLGVSLIRALAELPADGSLLWCDLLESPPTLLPL
jgi:hypothetical protein